MHISVKGIILFIATVLWLIFALYLSHQDGDHTREVSMGLAEKLFGWAADSDAGELQVVNSNLRRAAHVFLYTVLAVLMLLTFGEIWSGHRMIAVIVLIFIAVVDEVTKIPIEGRHCSGVDIGLNILGVAIGVVVIVLVNWISASHGT